MKLASGLGCVGRAGGNEWLWINTYCPRANKLWCVGSNNADNHYIGLTYCYAFVCILGWKIPIIAGEWQNRQISTIVVKLRPHRYKKYVQKVLLENLMGYYSLSDKVMKLKYFSTIPTFCDQGSIMQSLDVSFVINPDKLLDKQSSYHIFLTPCRWYGM